MSRAIMIWILAGLILCGLLTLASISLSEVGKVQNSYYERKEIK